MSFRFNLDTFWWVFVIYHYPLLLGSFHVHIHQIRLVYSKTIKFLHRKRKYFSLLRIVTIKA